MAWRLPGVRAVCAVLLLSVLLGGCVATSVSVAPPQDLPLADLLSLYAKRTEGLARFKGILKVALRSQQTRYPTVHATWQVQNGETTLRGFDLLGRSLFQLIASPSAVSFLPAQGTPIHWNPTEPPPDPLPWLPRGFLDWINQVNRIGMPDLDDAIHLRLKHEEVLRLSVTHEDGTQTLHQIERGHFYITKVERFDAAGRLQSTVTFDDYRTVGATQPLGEVAFPFLIKGTTDAGAATLTFQNVTRLEDTIIK